MSQSKLCPFCRGLNSVGERRCYRCGRPLPGPLASGVIGFFQSSFSGENSLTRLFVGACLVVFALCFASEHRLPLWQDQFALSTTLRFGGIWFALAKSQPWRYFSAIFVHANLMHVAFNCFFMVSVGSAAEREFGKARFAVLFLLSGALGFVASGALGGSMGSQGSSGAVFGLFGAVIGAAYARRDPNWKQLLAQNVVWILIISLLSSRADNAAHFGGLLAGAAIAYLFGKEPRKPNLTGTFAVLAVLLVAVSLAGVALSAASPIWRVVKAQELGQLY